MYLPFLPGHYYHIYNRGNNREDIFPEERNYAYFLDLYQKYLSDVVDTFAFNLLPGHFHIGARVKDEEDLIGQKPVHQCFSNMLNAYTKAINRAYGRRGSLFEKHLKRKLITDEDYLRRVIIYIHRNPEAHRLIDDFTRWPFSSFQAILHGNFPRIQGASVLDWFGGSEAFLLAHRSATFEVALP